MRCSSLKRYWFCPGSYRAEDLVPPKSKEQQAEEDEKSGAAQGRKLHAEMAAILNRLVGGDRKMEGTEFEALPWEVRCCLSTVDLSDAKHWLIEESLGRENITGHPDLVVVTNDGVVHLYDWKMGWGARGKSSSNIQGMGYMYLLWPLYNPPKAFYHLVCPNEPEEQRHTVSEYIPDTIEQVEIFVADVVSGCADPNAKRNPSAAACEFCPARGTTACQESCDLLKMETALVKTQSTLPVLSNEDLLLAMDQAKTLIPVAEAILDEGKARLACGSMETDLWQLRSGGSRKKIGDTRKCWDALKPLLGDDAKERTGLFLGACSLKLDPIARAVAKAQGVTIVDATEQVKAALGDLYSETPQADKMLRVK